jgi:hypothetical protein
MNCDEARRALLEADPAELRGTGTGALALHLRDCASCRADAERILEGTAALNTAIGQAAAARPAPGVPALRRRARAARTRLLVPLAAAAALAVLLLSGDVMDALRSGDDARPVMVQRPDALRTPSVNAAGGRGVAVMRTANPDITVVWTF